jgi:uncharacterized protein
MIHPNTELKLISNEIGYGVVATEFIPAGTITWVLDKLDREFKPEDVQAMHSIYQNILDTYTYRNNKGNFVLCWDNGRYVNHSFKSNCLSTAYDFEIAIQDIHPGEQLTDDYGYLNIPYPFKAVDEGTERKVVYPDDLLRYSGIWDKKIQAVFSNIITNKQPLKVLLTDEVWSKISRIARGEEELLSIRSTYFDDKASSNGSPV